MRPIIGVTNIRYRFQNTTLSAEPKTIANTISEDISENVSEISEDVSYSVVFYTFEDGTTTFSASDAVTSDLHSISTGNIVFTDNSIRVIIQCGYSIEFTNIVVRNLLDALSEETPITVNLEEFSSLQFNYTLQHPILDVRMLVDILPADALQEYGENRYTFVGADDSVILDTDSNSVEGQFGENGTQAMETVHDTVQSEIVENFNVEYDIDNPYNEFIPTSWLKPIFKKYGEDGIDAWNGIMPFLFTGEKLFGPNPRISSYMKDISHTRRIQIVSDIFIILQHETLPIEESVISRYQTFKKVSSRSEDILATDNIDLFKSRFSSGSVLRRFISEVGQTESTLDYSSVDKEIEQNQIWKYHSDNLGEEVVVMTTKRTPLVNENTREEILNSYGDIAAAEQMFWVPVGWEGVVLGLPERPSDEIFYAGNTDNSDVPLNVIISPDEFESGSRLESYTGGRNIVPKQ